jgi:hypothetical protein
MAIAVKLIWIKKLLYAAGTLLLYLPALSQTNSSIWQKKMHQVVTETEGLHSQITSGAITFSSATFSASLAIMALKISRKPDKDCVENYI